ncbi:carbonic anhydrase [Haematospirillum jordaniae]|nr:carbonic anhydrase [Haematospirillum jordaniae]NKD44409.1 carbonic anhydrase [Haematospirillum jordaniae]NKD57429.1 carbonic anhydrase [Haematospirillum jordaniae]NKD59873.1 carbonic anhydrase [Haematospirillum jordaniae]NKD67740.1 carbonic anhydrase [Haematospirillum jordaniae]NKD79904.1 carbonic anhydrase [Haematospirillum jordaniae]
MTGTMEKIRTIDRMVAGFRAFRSTYYEQRPERAVSLVEGAQQPEVLLIACSDSRVDPAILTNAEPGELFVVRNVAALVPPCEQDGAYHGTSAAIEYAVRDLKVADVIVLAHSGCGGMRALVAARQGQKMDRPFINPWISLMGDCAGHEDDDPDPVSQSSLRRSLSNLRTFPFVRDAENAGKIVLHGWWFDMREGILWQLDQESDTFVQMV